MISFIPITAMCTSFDCGLFDISISVTRSEDLNDIFKKEKCSQGPRNELFARGMRESWDILEKMMNQPGIPTQK